MSELALQLIRENIKKHQRGEDATYLNLGRCGLRELPAELGDCVWVETLVLSNSWEEYNLEEKGWEQKSSQNQGKPNQIASIKGVENLGILKKLVISMGPVDPSDPWELNDLKPLASLKYLQTLYFDRAQVSDLSPLAGLSQLQTLSLHLTQVSDLSPLAGLSQLLVLDCSSEQVSDLSPLASLSQLQSLYCYSTKVSDLSPLAGLSQLQSVHCHSTKVSDLSPLAGLSQLQTLNCSGTKVSDLSPLAGLSQLQTLYCYSTQVSDLSPLAGLSHLQTLDCHSTLVSDLSPLLALIKKGREVVWNRFETNKINVGDCPLVHPPPEIVKQGNEAILNYFREREKASASRPLRESKMLLLGEPGAGKTTLALKIENIGASLPRKDDSTRGIAVKSIKDGDFTINLWDFGGQQIYHGTHRFFLSKRSLWIVVCDNRRQDTDFSYWLQMAELYGEESPLYVVVNQSDDRPPYPNLGGMKERFDFLKDLLAANLDTNDESGVEKRPPEKARIEKNTRATQRLIDALKQRIRELPHVETEWPLGWYNVRQELERIAREEKRDYISLERYYDCCEREGIAERDRQLFLAAYLHDLGVILHFNDDPTLRETVILNMQWATDGVFKAYDDERVHSGERPGMFPKQDTAHIWAETRYQDKRDQLLALMLRFRLCYRVGDTDTYVMPELLPYAQPDYATHIPALDAAHLERAHAVRYTYEFMPKGIFARFACEVHRLIAWGQQFIWREGAVLQSGDSYALVKETYGSREIVVRAVGNSRKELMTIATHHLDSIHATFPRLRFKKLVPCDCNTCRRETIPNYYDFENLKERLKRGKTTVECGNSYEDVPVRRLLDEVFASENQAPEALEEQMLRGIATPGAKSLKLFISYSKNDKKLLDELTKQLAPLLRTQKIEIWYDEKLAPGSVWDSEIKYRLAEADVVLLLVSPDFLATDYIWDVEIPTALERHKKGLATVIPIILRESIWLETPLKDLSAIPAKGKAISKFSSRDQGFFEVVKALQTLIKEKTKS